MDTIAREIAPDLVQEGAAEPVKLLLVDDDRDNLFALQAVLEPLGQELLLADSGQSALRFCLDHDFAAILLDVRMPEIDGFETAELIRSRKRSSRTPILFLTGYRSDEQLFRGYDLGAVDFLFKPIVPEVLQSKVNVFVDLSRTERMLRRKTEALAATEQKFRAVLETAPDAMIITDLDGTLQLANSCTDALFGYERNELIGTNVQRLIPSWDGSRTAEAAAFGSPYARETRLHGLRRSGALFPIEVTSNVCETSEGTLITTAIRDATEKVLNEEKIRKINSDLERRVTERTADLTRSNEALRQFAWAASHDLQEPVRMVLSFSQWMARSAKQKLSPEEIGMLESVQQNAVRLETLLADLRQYIFLSESEQQVTADVDCNAVLENVKDCLLGAITESGAVLEIEPLPTVRSVSILLVQVFQNLISNSIKYRGDQSPRIRIEAAVAPTGVTFSVHDNGIGIDPAQAEYVFGVFKRLHGREFSGTGIGLAICRAAVERLGGKIWVEPKSPPGACIRFFVPQEGYSV